jgi:hypothetical protein
MELLTEDEAVARLKAICKGYGSVSAFARAIGVEASSLNAMVNKKTPIGPSVAPHIGVKRVYAYLDTGTKPDPKQEHYKKKREEWEQHCIELGYKSGTEGARRTGTFKRATSPDPLPDHAKAQRERRIERLAQREAEDKA